MFRTDVNTYFASVAKVFKNGFYLPLFYIITHSFSSYGFDYKDV